MKSPITRLGYAFLVAAAVTYAFFTVRGPHGYSAWMQKRQEVREMEQHNAAIARENQLQREYIQRLQDSKGEQEMAIRSRLKLVKPTDKVYMKKVAN
ncbi:MAG: septum formation initiator family protein [Bryobacteraceae bacterium]